VARKSVVARVYDVLDEDVYLRRAIELGVANLSAVAKRIHGDVAPEASSEAVRAAVRRYVSDLEAQESANGLEEVLAGTGFSLRSNISVIQAYQDRRLLVRLQETFRTVGREFNIVSSSNAITVITSDENAGGVVKLIGKENLITQGRGLHAIYLTSGGEIKSTPGFVSFISSLFLRKGINIIEFYSCYTDTVLIVSRADSLKAYELLDRTLGKKPKTEKPQVR
jgi:hypothetical protein